MSLKIYGLSNCDTVRKVRKTLDGENIDYVFHDFCKDGLTPETVVQMIDALGLDALVNKKGTTWRKLTEGEHSALGSKSEAVNLLIQNVALIKRPVWQKENDYKLGFHKNDQESLLIWAKS